MIAGGLQLSVVVYFKFSWFHNERVNDGRQNDNREWLTVASFSRRDLLPSYPKGRKSKYPRIDHGYESLDYPGLYYAGTVTHSLDLRKSAGGFIHGFRYTGKYIHIYSSNSGNSRERERERERESLFIHSKQ